MILMRDVACKYRSGLMRLSLMLCSILPAVALAGAAVPTTALHGGAVAAPDPYGARAAQEILKAGGNAVDAAVATAFTLAVTYPMAGNLGGGGFMTLYVDGKPYFLDYRERAPVSASRDMYLDKDGNVIPDLSLVGHKASGVPGTVRGLWVAHQRFGKLSWRQDLQPALRLARQGFVVSPYLADSVHDEQKSLHGRTNFDHYFNAVRVGQRWRQPELAATLSRIATQGDAGFYQGLTAQYLIAEMKHGHGEIAQSDLDHYEAVWRAPLSAQWRDYTILTAPPPSSGGIGLIQLLSMKEKLSDVFAGLALNSAQYLHLSAEIEKRVFADRAEYLGDPDFVSVPVARLVDPQYLTARAHEVNVKDRSATEVVQPGLTESHQTTHFSIVDHDGNAVANTYTLNDEFGNGVVVAGAGFLLNNEMDDFSVKTGVPNLFGVVGKEANAIAPGKRPLSSMTPTLLTRNGQIALVIGTPGGSRIFTSVFQVICNLYDFGLAPAQALAAPRVHHQLLPADTLFEEPYAQVTSEVRTQLINRGYRFENQGWNGDIEMIQIKDQTPTPAADPRGIGVGLRTH